MAKSYKVKVKSAAFGSKTTGWHRQYTVYDRATGKMMGGVLLVEGAKPREAISGYTEIFSQYQRRGIASSLYEGIARDLARSGRVLVRSPEQTAAGRAMWDSFERRGLVRNNTLVPQTVNRRVIQTARAAGRIPALAIAAAGAGMVMAAFSRASPAAAMTARASQERRSRASTTTIVRGHYARGPNGSIAWVKQHTRRVG